jgi:alkylglycerol monooxygenase
MDFNPIILSIPIYFLLIGIELLIQFFADRKLYRLPDAITNISCGITQQLTGIFFKVLGVGVYVFIFTHLSLTEIPVTWWSWIVLFIAADFCYYWAHRKSHEINLFWGGHVVHHQSEDYNFSVALRQGSFQIIWTFGFYLPLAVIGFDPTQFVIASALVTVYQFWIHTETIGKLGWFEYVFNTPSHHRVHHGRDPKYIDKNHAGVFIIWDRMFGTFQVEEEKPVYGVTTPPNSWNPVWVNVDHYHSMYQKMRQIEGWSDRLKYLVYKPGWLPESMGGYQRVAEVDRDAYRKFETAYPIGTGYYVLVQYLLVLGLTAIFLFLLNDFLLWEQGVVIAFVIWTILNCGGLFEQRRWAGISEFMRVLIGSLACSFVIYISQLSSWLYLPVIIFNILSLGWLFQLYKILPKETSVS